MEVGLYELKKHRHLVNIFRWCDLEWFLPFSLFFKLKQFLNILTNTWLPEYLSDLLWGFLTLLRTNFYSFAILLTWLMLQLLMEFKGWEVTDPGYSLLHMLPWTYFSARFPRKDCFLSGGKPYLLIPRPKDHLSMRK